MKKFIESIKGFLIGLGSITPGLSGGTIAILTGLYDRIIYNIGHFYVSNRITYIIISYFYEFFK